MQVEGDGERIQIQVRMTLRVHSRALVERDGAEHASIVSILQRNNCAHLEAWQPFVLNYAA